MFCREERSLECCEEGGVQFKGSHAAEWQSSIPAVQKISRFQDFRSLSIQEKIQLMSGAVQAMIDEGRLTVEAARELLDSERHLYALANLVYRLFHPRSPRKPRKSHQQERPVVQEQLAAKRSAAKAEGTSHGAVSSPGSNGLEP